jgi:hypothetical protein
VIKVARQLGHDARLTLSTYGHVIDMLDERPHLDSESAIEAARHTVGKDSGKSASAS